MNRTFAAIVAAIAVLAALIFPQSAGAQSASAMNRMSPEQAREENAYMRSVSRPIMPSELQARLLVLFGRSCSS
jgi:hypothetical protein